LGIRRVTSGAEDRYGIEIGSKIKDQAPSPGEETGA
jgi:hypothetical protein